MNQDINCFYHYLVISVHTHPFTKGGGFESWENPPKSPFAKGGLLEVCLY